MAYSDNFPATRPVFMADFANGGKIDPRASYSRSTTGTYFGTAKHLSSENLLQYSSGLDGGTWVGNGLSSRTAGQTDPSGGSAGFALVEDSANSYHRIYQVVSQTNKTLTFTVYAKRNSGSRYLMLGLGYATNNYEVAVFDLSGGAPATASGSSSTYTSVSATQTPSGNGYYKCTIQATGNLASTQISIVDSGTPAPDLYGLKLYTGDGTSSLNIAFPSLTTTGATDYNATTAQIHREYAPTLQTAAINSPRFEYSATDGQSMGILIESQATNLQRYGNAVGSWNLKPHMTITADAAVAPDGSLTAQSVVPTAISEIHYILDTSVSFASGTTYTSSVFVKSAGYRYIQLGGGSSPFGSSAFVNFDLTDGSYTATGMTATATAVGNDWWRLTVTATATATATEGFYLSYVTSKSAARAAFATGDGYSGYLLYGFQTESGSFASSLVNTGTGSSALTRAAESLSVAMADVGVSQGPVSAVVEGSAGSGSTPHLISLSDGTTVNRWAIYRDSLTADTSTDYRLFVRTDNSSVVSKVVSGSASATKFAMRIDTDNFAVCADGGTVETDTAGVAPVTTTIHIADDYNGGNQANGHIKRLALYGDLSDTNLQALTS